MNLNTKLLKIKVKKFRYKDIDQVLPEAGYHRQYNCDFYYIIDYDTRQPFTMCLLTTTLKHNNF